MGSLDLSPLQTNTLMSAILAMLLYGGTEAFVDLLFYSESKTVEITCKQIISRDVPSKDGNEAINSISWLIDRHSGDGHNLYCIDSPIGTRISSKENHMIGDSIQVSVSSRGHKRVFWGSRSENLKRQLVWLFMTVGLLCAVVSMWKDYFKKQRAGETGQ